MTCVGNGVELLVQEGEGDDDGVGEDDGDEEDWLDGEGGGGHRKRTWQPGYADSATTGQKRALLLRKLFCNIPLDARCFGLYAIR